MIGYPRAAIQWLTLATALAGATSVRADDRAIVPGQSIGQVRLKTSMEALTLGPPTFGDGAAGTIWSTWNAKKPEAATGIIHTVDVLGHLGERGHDVWVVRVTSPWFHTSGGLSTGSTLAEIRRRFPQVRRVARYNPRQVPISVAVYDDVAHGVAFELLCDTGGSATPGSRCLAISVHPAGKPIQNEPLALYLESKAGIEGAGAPPRK